MNVFEVGFKLRCGEMSDWGTELLKAHSKRQALTKFARRKKINQVSAGRPSSWTWDDALWTASFRYIKRVKLVSCPHCHGDGFIAVSGLSRRTN
jgi:hypothetical protein